MTGWYGHVNGINESSHRFLEHCIATDTGMADPKKSIEEIVAKATMVHNGSPHASTGESPINLTMGVDMCLPGWQEWAPTLDEREREEILATKRSDVMISNFENIQGEKGTMKRTIKIGDIVVYELRFGDKDITHVSQDPAHKAQNSLPGRVMRIKGAAALVKPLWTREDLKWIPFNKIKIVNEPSALQHALVKKMFPMERYEEEKRRKRSRRQIN